MSDEHEPPSVPGESVAPRLPSPERIADLKAKLQAEVLLAYENQKLRATISRLRDALTAAAEQRNYLSSPYDTGWQDAIRWINQQVDDAAMAGGK